MKGLWLLFLMVGISLGLIFSGTAQSKEFVFKIATLAPKNVGWAKHIRKIFIPAIKKKTNGEIKLKWYWGGVMGDDKDALGKMKIGQLDGAALTGQGVFLAIPQMSVLGLPFMFNDFDEVDYIRKKMFHTFEKYAMENGFKFLSWADQDFDQIYSVKYPMSTQADFGKVKIITWFGVVEKNLLIKLGASPVPVGPVEITPSIRQGIADALIAPAVWVVGAQMYTTFKYVNPVRIRYSPAATIVTKSRWDSYPELTKKYGELVYELQNNELVEFVKATRADSTKAYAAMIKRGMKESIYAPAEMEKMKIKAMEIWDELADKLYPKSLLEELKRQLKDYRAKR